MVKIYYINPSVVPWHVESGRRKCAKVTETELLPSLKRCGTWVLRRSFLAFEEKKEKKRDSKGIQRVFKSLSAPTATDTDL